MAPSSPAPLQDLGTLVFGDDALDLQQQVVFGTGADRAVEEGDRSVPGQKVRAAGAAR
jgi:hypothetical protein